MNTIHIEDLQQGLKPVPDGLHTRHGDDLRQIVAAINAERPAYRDQWPITCDNDFAYWPVPLIPEDTGLKLLKLRLLFRPGDSAPHTCSGETILIKDAPSEIQAHYQQGALDATT